MKNAYIFIALFAAIFAAAAPAFAESETCSAARNARDMFFGGVLKTCATNDDCAAYYYRDSCGAPVVLPKNHDTEAFKAELKKQDEAVFAACETPGTAHPACSPAAVNPVCVQNECVNRFGQ